MLHKVVLSISCPFAVLLINPLSLWVKSLSVTIQVKATEQWYFPVVLFIMLYKVVLTSCALLKTPNKDFVSFQMEAIY